jgi:hypothetical protein
MDEVCGGSSGGPSQEASDTEPTMENFGVFTFETLQRIREAQPQDLVEGLIRDRSIGLLVGDSGLGKTPLCISLGIAVASGTPFLGRAVSRGRVLYCDAESGVAEFLELLRTISQTAGLAEPPRDFHVWSPNFEEEPSDAGKSWGSRLFERVKLVRPRLVIADSFRTFWPAAEEKAKEAMAVVKVQRDVSREIGCTWLASHHRRKRDRDSAISLLTDRYAWFQEAAGSLAIVNHVDTRLGVEPADAPADLVLAGFVRSLGWVGPVHLQRLADDDGDPVGYKVLTGEYYLSPTYQNAFRSLPERLRFKDAHAALGGKSASNATEFLRQAVAAGLLRKDGREYVKVAG